jgi:hypothetical protein
MAFISSDSGSTTNFRSFEDGFGAYSCMLVPVLICYFLLGSWEPGNYPTSQQNNKGVIKAHETAP